MYKRQNVSNALGIKPNQEIPNTPEARMILAQAITRQEGAEKATARFAEGGHIKHFAVGGMDDNQYSPEGVMVSGSDTTSGDDNVIGNALRSAVGLPKYQPFEAPKPKATDQAKNKTDTSNTVDTSASTNQASSASATIQSSTTNAPVDPYQALMDKLDARESDAKKQKTIDGYMGLLTAGLGMMGGSSPYAMENIGKGALAGVQQYGESQKLAASETANRDKTMASLIRAKQLGDISQATQRRLNTQFQQAQSDKVTQQAQSNFQQALKMRQAALAKDPTFLAKSEAEQNSLLYSDPVVQRYAQAAGFDPSLFGGSSGNTIKVDSSGKVIK